MEKTLLGPIQTKEIKKEKEKEMKRERHSKLTITGIFGGARGVMVIIVGNGPGDTSSNPGRDC